MRYITVTCGVALRTLPLLMLLLESSIMDFSGTNYNPLEEAGVLIPEATDNPLKLSKNYPQHSFENKQVEEIADLLAASTVEMKTPEVEEITVMGDIKGDGKPYFDDVRDLLRSYRPGVTEPDDLLDINGDGRTPFLEVRELGRIVRNNTDQTTPNILAISLLNDIGISQRDKITSAPTSTGTIRDLSDIENLELRKNLGESSVDVTNLIEVDGSLKINETILEQISNNSPFNKGEYSLSFVGKDSTGNINNPFNISFSLDTNATVTNNLSQPITETTSSNLTDSTKHGGKGKLEAKIKNSSTLLTRSREGSTG